MEALQRSYAWGRAESIQALKATYPMLLASATWASAAYLLRVWLKLRYDMWFVHDLDPELHLGVINSHSNDICHCCCIAARHADHHTGGSTKEVLKRNLAGQGADVSWGQPVQEENPYLNQGTAAVAADIFSYRHASTKGSCSLRSVSSPAILN